MRRKLSPAPVETAKQALPTRKVELAAPTRYQAALARARSMGLFTAMVIAPLGALAGSVAACGGAAPVQAYPSPSGGSVEPIATIEPPPATSTSAVPTEAPQKKLPSAP
ncbi:MAG: hypothetical protein K1X94_34820 [Sandaracinaceae bacterium]|nr:hypothetical protein [Sandaracinaceae bacterium]